MRQLCPRCQRKALATLRDKEVMIKRCDVCGLELEPCFGDGNELILWVQRIPSHFTHQPEGTHQWN
jgi:hypothetical protein